MLIQDSTLQKQEQKLKFSYVKAMNFFYNNQPKQGLSLIYQILQDPLIDTNAVLKYSALMSAAEVEDKTFNNIQESIKCMYKALKVKEDYTLYKRLCDACVKGGYLKQAEYSILMALESCPVHTKNYLIEVRIDVKILEEEYVLALEIIDQLIEGKFAIERQNAKKVYCFNKLGRKTEAQHIQSMGKLENPPDYDQWREGLGKQQPSNLQRQPSMLQEIPKPLARMQEEITDQPPMRIKIQSSKCSWHSLIGQAYLMLKYYLVKKQQRKKTMKPKLKGMEEYFSIGKWVDRTIIIGVDEPTEEEEKNMSYSELYMNFKRRKNKDTTAKLFTDEQEKKYVSVKWNGNFKDLISNTGIHIDSLVNIQSQNKRKNIEKISYLRRLNETILPFDDYYRHFFSKISENPEFVELVDLEKCMIKGTEQRPIEIDDEPRVEKTTDSRFQDDFNLFCSGRKSYLTLFELCRDIIFHFLSDREDNKASSSPHPLLECDEFIITNLLTKLYIACNKLCLNLFSQNQILVPILELMVDRYGELLRKVSKNKEIQGYLKQDREFIRKIIIEIESQLFNFEFGTYLRTLSEKTQITTKLRVYHSLAIFYSFSDQEIIAMASEMVEKYEKQLTKYREKFDSEEVERFWLSAGATKPNLRQFIDNRIKQNLLKKQIDQKGGCLSDALSVSIQNFKKLKDRDVNDALQLYYKNILDLLQDSTIYPLFLNHLSEIFEIYLDIIQRKPFKEDYCKYMYKIGELMKIDDISSLFIKRTNQQDKRETLNLAKEFTKLTMIFAKMTVQKLILLEPEQQGHNNVFKGLLCALNQLFRYLDNKNDSLMNDIVILVHEMAHFSNDNSNVHKKLNLHFVPKFLQTLLKDPRIQQEEQRQILLPPDESRSKKEQQSYKDNVGSILECYYGYSGKKSAEFSIQTKKDVENFVRYLKHFFSQYFDDPSCKIKISINNMLRECRKIQKEMAKEILFCPGLERLSKKLIDWYTFDKKDEGFLERIRQYVEGESGGICEEEGVHDPCFQNVKGRYGSYLDVNYMTARSLENEEVADNEEYKQDIERGIKKSEKIYLELLCFDLQNVDYWYCVSKINKKKAYIGFDEIIYGDISNEWKNGFIASKRIAAFMKSSLKIRSSISQDLDEDTLILNLLKIYERKMLCIESKVYDLPDQEARKNKLLDAYQTVISRMDVPANQKNERIIFLFTVYCQYPYMKQTNFCSKQSITIISTLDTLYQSIKSKSINERVTMSEDQIQMETYFLLFDILKKYHRTLALVQEQMGSSDNLLKLGFKDLQLFLQYISTSLPHTVGKKPSEQPPPRFFQTGAKKLSKTQLSIKQMQQTVKWLPKLPQPTQSPTQYLPIKHHFDLIMFNLKDSILQSYKSIQSKKGRFHRYFVNCCYYLSKITTNFEDNPREGLKVMGDVSNLKSDEIVMIYRYYENQSLQKDMKLAQFFNRNLFFFINKNKIIKWVIHLLWENQEDDKLLQLYRKFIKSAPKEDQRYQNRALGFLYQTTLKGIVMHLMRQLEQGPLGEEGERWMMELFDKNIRKRTKGKDKEFQMLSRLVIEYYKRDEKYQALPSHILEFERGRLILEDKFRAKKSQKEPKTPS